MKKAMRSPAFEAHDIDGADGDSPRTGPQGCRGGRNGPGNADRGGRRRAGNILTGLVRDECANWVGGRCMGLTVYSVPFRAPGACSIMQGKPCAYFERTILKAARKEGNEKALRKYAEIAPEACTAGEARRCECGAMLPPRKRLCLKCAKRNRQKTYRTSQQRRRFGGSGCQQLTKNDLHNALLPKEL